MNAIDKEKIENARKTIRSLMEEQDNVYRSLMSDLGGSTIDGENLIWDYCFNCETDINDDTNEYANRLRGLIYGNDE